MKHPFFMILAAIYCAVYIFSLICCFLTNVKEYSKGTMLLFVVASSYLIYYLFF